MSLLCLLSALFNIPSQVNWMHYELESKLKELLFWLHGKQSIAIVINISANWKNHFNL